MANTTSASKSNGISANRTLSTTSHLDATLGTPHAAEKEAAAKTTSTTSPTTTPPPTEEENDNEGDDLTPHQIAIKRTKRAKERLATAHEGWLLVARALHKSGALPAEDEEGLAAEMHAFGDAICGRYAAATFLWLVLRDMPARDWFGNEGGDKFEATLRRLGTLKGLEGSLAWWEAVVLEMVDLVEGGEEKGLGEGVVKEVRRLLGRWRRGLPERP
ncbi:hypothetical protein VTK56DRAFT_10113 [Thermocarpiscus australiensis]